MPGLIDVQANVQTKTILPLKDGHNHIRTMYQSFLTNPNSYHKEKNRPIRRMKLSLRVVRK